MTAQANGLGMGATISIALKGQKTKAQANGLLLALKGQKMKAQANGLGMGATISIALKGRYISTLQSPHTWIQFHRYRSFAALLGTFGTLLFIRLA